MTLHELLGQIPIFRQFPDLGAFAAEHARVARLQAGDLFFRKGLPCPLVAFVASGSLRVYALAETGREITLYHVTEGQSCLVNLLSAYLDQPCPAAAQAESAVEALVLPADSFRTWVSREPRLRQEVFRSISMRVIDLLMLVEEIAFLRIDERLSGYLASHFRDAGGAALVTTHEEIAAELGTAREVISRLLKELERRGALRMGRGRIELADRTRLGDPASPPVPGREFPV